MAPRRRVAYRQGMATATLVSEAQIDAEVLDLGRRLVRTQRSLAAVKRAPHERGMALMGVDPQLKAALFQLVDVAPACLDAGDVAAHLQAYMDDVDGRAIAFAGRTVASLPDRAVGSVASAAINQMAHRFIVGESPAAAAKELGRLWRRGSAVSVDLLGEATVTPAEGESYALRCEQALASLSATTRTWPARELLERDSIGRLPRVNLSVKVTALTPVVRALAPERAREDAAEKLRRLLRQAKQLGAHLHIDMESFDSREVVLGLVLGLLAEPEFADGPSAGMVLQAYLRDSEEMLDGILDWAEATQRSSPLTIRLVKGAYWDHESIDAIQHGWPSPVWSQKVESDRCFERLTRRLMDAHPLVRPVIASHNLRSISHAIVYARRRGLPDQDIELQVLRGLGDGLQDALAREGFRSRTYCPVGDLVSGMAYLVRRLLENTSNDSFLADHASGTALEELLARP